MLIGLNKDPKSNVFVGLVVTNGEAQTLAEPSSIRLNFNLAEVIDNHKIYKLDNFNSNIINDFAIDAGLSGSLFMHFFCHEDDINDMIRDVIQMYS